MYLFSHTKLVHSSQAVTVCHGFYKLYTACYISVNFAVLTDIQINHFLNLLLKFLKLSPETRLMINLTGSFKALLSRRKLCRLRDHHFFINFVEK